YVCRLDLISKGSHLLQTRRQNCLFGGYGDDQVLHSFPTRRSSDLERRVCSGPSKFSPSGRATPTSRPSCGLVGFTTIHATREYQDRKSTRLNSSHVKISYAVFCLKKKRYQARMDSQRQEWNILKVG